MSMTLDVWLLIYGYIDFKSILQEYQSVTCMGTYVHT